MSKRKTIEETFWEHVHKTDGCWEWIGAKRGGRLAQYGNCRGRVASRVSWELHNEAEIPDGMYVLHKCDNPPCVNPDHLFLGTIKENSRDMMLKGRKQTILNWESVAEIRRFAKYGISCKELADAYGVTRASISLIARNKQWAVA